MTFAPIALFTFKRPEHTLRTLQSLATNSEFADSPLIVFCDGARRDSERDAVEQSREVVRRWVHPHKRVIESDVNLGLARSVIRGVTQLCEEFGRVIVMEDDLLVSPVFLAFMNGALDRYAQSEGVFQVTGHMWPVQVSVPDDAFFMPLTNSLGWGTWQRAWRQLDREASAWPAIRSQRSRRRQFDLGGRFPFGAMMEKSLRGQVDSWAILWYLTVFQQRGVVLHPARSLVVNIGFDGVGTHSISEDRARYGSQFATQAVVRLPEQVVADEQAFEQVCRFLSRDGSLQRRLIRRLKLMLQRAGLAGAV